jgi:1-acyl-sn-glycerol-3-phosphate acyltransferase
VLSIWSWFVLGAALFFMVPLVGLIRLATWRDEGRYQAGLMFRRIAVVHQKLNPSEVHGVGQRAERPPPPVRRRRQPRQFRRHPADLALAVRDEVDEQDRDVQDPVRRMGYAPRGDIELDRSDACRRTRPDRAAKRLKNHVSVMIFPEGTRSESGELQEFKDGAFRLALQLGLPILPLAVIGTRRADQARLAVRIQQRRGACSIRSRRGMTKRDAPALRERTHNEMPQRSPRCTPSAA